MTIPINPYVAGNSVGDSTAFVGRADVLRGVVYQMPEEQGLDSPTSEECE